MDELSGKARCTEGLILSVFTCMCVYAPTVVCIWKSRVLGLERKSSSGLVQTLSPTEQLNGKQLPFAQLF